MAYGAGELAAEIARRPRRRADPRGPRAECADALVVIASYSGDDQEALDCFEEAGRNGAPRAVVTTGGRLAARAREEGVPVIGVPGGFPDPSAAIVYFTLAAVQAAAPSLRAELEAAVPFLLKVAESRELRRTLDAERARAGRTPPERPRLEPAVTRAKP